MESKYMMAACAVLVVLSAGCEKVDRRYGGKHTEPHRVTLYAEGEVVRTWVTDGDVYNGSRSDYCTFVVDGKLVKVSGSYVVEPATAGGD